MRAKCNQPWKLRYRLLLVCLPGVAAAQADAGGWPIFDRAVAAVDGRVITESQLQFEGRVLLINSGGVEAAFAELDRPALQAALQAMIDQRLAVRQADQLEAWALERDEMDKAVAGFRARFSSEAAFRKFLSQHQASIDELASVLRRSLRAQRAIDGKLRLKAEVSESDALRSQSERPELRGLPLDSVRQRLTAERFTQLVRVELAQARRSADVRLLGPYAPAHKGGQ